jgi:hypothetical protein
MVVECSGEIAMLEKTKGIYGTDLTITLVSGRLLLDSVLKSLGVGGRRRRRRKRRRRRRR